MSGTFAADVARFAEKAKTNGDKVLRTVCLELLNRVVLRSPVGNPDLWKANQSRLDDRITINQLRGLAGKKPFSERTLRKKLPLTAGKGYTGGRFRGSWTVTLNAPSTTVSEAIDRAGQATIKKGSVVIAETHLGAVVYMVSNLPYSQRLEEGWSKQAPAGVVGVTVVEFQSIVNLAVSKL